MSIMLERTSSGGGGVSADEFVVAPAEARASAAARINEIKSIRNFPFVVVFVYRLASRHAVCMPELDSGCSGVS
jgi:hypothetical protein